MVIQTVAAPPIRFPDAPQKGDMQNLEQIYRPSMVSALELYLNEVEADKPPEQRRSVYVGADIQVRPRPTLDYSRLFVPDLTVAFDVDADVIKRDNGFSIENLEKPPSLVLEVASPSTGTRDFTIKRSGYAGFSVNEYWRTDPSGGRWHNAALAGDRLVNGRYVPIPIERAGVNMLRGYSRVLGLYVCWEDGDLRFYHPEKGYLLTHVEEREGRLAAETRARRLEERIRRLESGDEE